MGLDQYAYAVKGEEEVFLADWRKHNRLQGWMEQLWQDKGCPNGDEDDGFNSVALEITEEDLLNLEDAIDNFEMPETSGFFFGNDSYSWNDDNGNPFPENEYWYKDTDIAFVINAKKALTEGGKVYYNSWY